MTSDCAGGHRAAADGSCTSDNTDLRGDGRHPWSRGPEFRTNQFRLQNKRAQEETKRNHALQARAPVQHRVNRVHLNTADRRKGPKPEPRQTVPTLSKMATEGQWWEGVWCGCVVWCGVVWCGVVWCGVVCVRVGKGGEERREEGRRVSDLYLNSDEFVLTMARLQPNYGRHVPVDMTPRPCACAQGPKKSNEDSRPQQTRVGLRIRVPSSREK